MFEFVDFVGYAGTITAFSFMIPQVYRTYTTKSVEDISWAMLVILLTNGALWLTYGLLLDSIPLIIANSISIVVTSTQIILKILYRHNP